MSLIRAAAAAIALAALIAVSACSASGPSDSAASPAESQTPAGTATTPTATPTPTPTPKPTPTPTKPKESEAKGTVEGNWCPTKQSNDKRCLTVKLPKVTYDDGSSDKIVGKPFPMGDGALQYSFAGAPFGTFYPAGTKIDIPDYYSGKDLPDQDRIWNSQTGDLYVRGKTG